MMYPARRELIQQVLSAFAPLLKSFICSDIYSEPSLLEHNSDFSYVSLHIFPLHPWTVCYFRRLCPLRFRTLREGCGDS